LTLMPVEVEPPELARLIDFAERPRVDDWSLRAALVRYAQPEPQRAARLLEVVRRAEGALNRHGKLLEGNGPTIWATLGDDPPARRPARCRPVAPPRFGAGVVAGMGGGPGGGGGGEPARGGAPPRRSTRSPPTSLPALTRLAFRARSVTALRAAAAEFHRRSP